MKIGVYGGTFNPIHLGHVHILKEFIRRLSLDLALVIPTHVPPHKQAMDLASPENRLRMCDLALEEVKEAKTSTIELSREGKSFTALTLMTLSQRYPGDRLYLLMGEDMFLTVDRWYRPQTIAELAVLCCSPRSENGLSKLLHKAEELEKSLGARCAVENIPWLPVSSTEIRKRAALGESLAGMVPPRVEAYMKETRLYRKENGE